MQHIILLVSTMVHPYIAQLNDFYYNSIVHPGMPVHFDPPSLNIHCEGVIGPRTSNLVEFIEKSYGFTFVGPVSMETLLTFEPAVFC